MSRRARAAFTAFVARREAAWELTFAALAVAFVAVGLLPTETPATVAAEWILTAVFAAEFGTRLYAAESRQAYVRAHWIDLVALVPPTRGLRVLRLLRLLRLVRAFAGVARALTSLERLANHRGLVWLLTAWIGVMVLTSIGLYAAERGVNAAVTTPLDALWWGVTTMTTVGYGDVYPITPEGRLAAATLMLLGIGLFSAITAVGTSFLLEGRAADPLDQIRKLGDLHRDGVVDDVEYATKKAELLGRM